jgi:hypothetical protein
MNKYLTLLLVLVACTSKKHTDPEQVCQPGFKPDRLKSAKGIDSSATTANDPRTVTLSINKFNSPSYSEASTIADSALHIASVLLSSKDFESAISKLTFTCRNFDYYCKDECKSCNDRFNGSVVLDKVFSESSVKLDLYLQKCGNEFGHATRNIKEIYSCQSVVFFDEPGLSNAYCYAYHIAHEYMHIVGFFHTDHRDDVAEKTGWLGWEILLNWKEKGINVMQYQPGEL